MVEPLSICSSTEVGSLGVLHLKRLWSKILPDAQDQLSQEALAKE